LLPLLDDIEIWDGVELYSDIPSEFAKTNKVDPVSSTSVSLIDFNSHNVHE
jgi:hypothetical protein